MVIARRRVGLSALKPTAKTIGSAIGSANYYLKPKPLDFTGL